jgi:DNA-binding CsgD family transcriptional regulator
MTDISVDDFIQRAATASSLRDLVHLFEELFSGLGFETLSYHLARKSFRSVPATQGARVTGEADLLDSLYGSDQPLDFDPVVSELLDKLEPFHWFESEKSGRISDGQKLVIEKIRADGFVDGIVVPVMTRPGDVAVFLLSKRGVRFTFSAIEMRKLQLACHSMHLRFEELKNGDPKQALSTRETDVLRLAARGKSNKEIALALGVSAHTVDTLIRRCFIKLGVSNRIEAAIMFTFDDRLSA